MKTPTEPKPKEVEWARLRLLRRIEDALELPMVILGLIWLILLIIELTQGLSRWLEIASLSIWVVFIFDFLLKLVIAPKKWQFIRTSWLTVIALILPALRVLRIVRLASLMRAARATRGIRLVRVVSSINRGMKALGNTMSRRGFGYVMAITVIVTFAGAAGMFALERDAANASPMFQDYGSALWWTAMMMTTMGSDGWPQTSEGRLLCLLLAIYAFGVFGYFTATIASFFIGQDKGKEPGPPAALAISGLRDEIVALRRELQMRTGDDGSR